MNAVIGSKENNQYDKMIAYNKERNYLIDLDWWKKLNYFEKIYLSVQTQFDKLLNDYKIFF